MRQEDRFGLLGALDGKIKAVTTTYTITNDDLILNFDSTAGAFTATLPTVASASTTIDATTGLGQILFLTFNTDNGDVTIEGAGAETINGAANYTFADVGDSLIIACDGTEWQILATGPATAATVADGAVTTAKLAADAVDGTKLADDAVDSEHIADGAIDTAFFAAGAVDTAALGSAAVTLAKMAANSVDSSQLIAGAVDLGHMAANSVGTSQLVAASVTTAKIAADNITSALIADAQVDSEHIVAGAIDTAHIAADQITSALIADDQVDSEHLAAGGIDAEHLANGACTPLACEGETTNTVDTDHTVLATDRVILVSESDAGAHTITFGDTAVAGHKVTVVMTAATTGSYVTSGIDSGEVTFDTANQSATFAYDEGADGWYRVASGGPTMIDSGDIVAGAIDVGHMAANSVDSTQIAAGAVDTAHIAADQITNALIADAQVDSEHLVDGSVDEVHMSTARYRAVTDGGALTLAATDSVLQITNTASGAVAATMTATHAGHTVFVRMIAGDGANYYTMAVNGGTITLNAANEACIVSYSGSAWQLQGLMGATFA